MLPLRDENPRRSTPVFTLLIILVNLAVFLYQVTLSPPAEQQFFQEFAMIPARIPLAFANPSVTFSQAFVPLLTSIFLHGSLLHLAGNMWFLWVFGDNVEDRFGHSTYLMFYLICGVGASVIHTIFNLDSGIPAVGASGAISGAMGAYFVLFPRARVLTWVPPLFIIPLPAYVVLVVWFLLQFFGGLQSLGAQAAGGVAFWAHVGGFVLGVLLAIASRGRR